MIAGHPGVIGNVACVWQFGDMKISDQDDVELLIGKILDHLLESGESVPIHGEWAIV